MSPEMRDFLAGVTLLDLTTWAAFTGGVFVVIKWVIPLGRKISHFIDDVAGEPARLGVPARPGLMERVQLIEHELHPNSGKSLRDQTNRMEQKLDRDNDRITDLSSSLDVLTDRLDEHIAQYGAIIENLPKGKP